jgi:hypothetical protein
LGDRSRPWDVTIDVDGTETGYRVDAVQAKTLAMRASGSLTKRVQKAWQRLRAAAEAGEQDAVDALREAWLRDGRDETWAYAGQWCPPEVVFAAAVDPARSAEARAVLGEYCARHDLVPENAYERVVFFVLTGAVERYEATDPDGTLLAGAYRGADDMTRDALRRMMVATGGLDTVRVIAGHPGGALSAEEANHVAGQLALTREWDRLWRLVPAMPVASAMWAASLFEDWRPAGETDRAYFDRLVATDPDALAALDQAAVTELDAPYDERSPFTASFTPDGAEVLVRGHDVRLFAVPGGDLVARFPDTDERLALGAGTIVHIGRDRDGLAVMRTVAGRPPEILSRCGTYPRIAATPTGFVVQENGTLWRGGLLAWTGPIQLPFGATATLTAVDRTTGTLAFSLDAGDVVLLDARLRVLAKTVLGTSSSVLAVCGPGTVLVWNEFSPHLASWRRDGGSLVPSAVADVDADMWPVPVLGQVAARRDGVLTWLDGDTLTEVTGPPGLAGQDRTVVAFSPDGMLAAVADDGWFAVHHLGLHRLAALTDRALTEAWPTDLDLVTTLAELPLSPQARDAVELLRAGLTHTIGTDIALGGAGMTVHEDDIALGGGV